MTHWTTLLAAAALGLVYLLGGRLRGESETAGSLRQGWLSAAAGVSVAYVFIDVLPELSAHNIEFVDTLGEHPLFRARRLYAVALGAFVVLYGLEHIAWSARRSDTASTAGDRMYWPHVLGYAAYSWLIGLLVVERGELGVRPLAVYAVAMALHFMVVAHSLGERHGSHFERRGRPALAASVLIGWLTATVVHVPAPIVAWLFAFLAGGVVITSLRGELPEGSTAARGGFWPFTLGATAYAVLLMAG